MCDNICGVTQLYEPITSTNKALRSIRKRDLSSDGDEGKISEAVVKLEVTGEGTKLMESLKLPTVLIRVCNGDLVHSTVHHALLELKLAKSTMRIVALMLPDPSSQSRSQLAELLPLSVELDGKGSISFVPTLSTAANQNFFCTGSLLKVLAIRKGRFVKWGETLPWNLWNVQSSVVRSTITEILAKDILDMPRSMVKIATNTRATDTHTSIQGYSSSFSSSSAGSHGNNSWQNTRKYDLSAYYPRLRFRGAAASGGSSFAKWFKLVPPTIRIDTNFKCDRGTTLKKDRFFDTNTFHRYLLGQNA